MSTSRAQDAYRKIILAARSIAQTTNSATRIEDKHRSNATSNSPVLSLRPSPSIRAALFDSGVPPEAAEKLSAVYSSIAGELRLRLEAGFRDTWTNIALLPRHDQMQPLDVLGKQLKKTYGTLYQRRLDDWKNEILRSATSRMSVSMGDHNREGVRRGVEDQSISKKPAFNNDYLPLLEAYFAENSKPSRADKIYLAKKSRMTFKQIHVWFQNKRRRSKKAQQVLHSSAEGSSSHLLAGINNCSHVLRPLSVVSDESVVAFFKNTPSYAFPTAYPPDFLDDPFPCRYGEFSCFMKPSWRRKPAEKLRASDTETSMSSLIAAFDKLTISESFRAQTTEDGFRPTQGLQSSSKKARCDTIYPYAVQALRAPLVSLVRVPGSSLPVKPCSGGSPRRHNEVVSVVSITSPGETEKLDANALQRFSVSSGRASGRVSFGSYFTPSTPRVRLEFPTPLSARNLSNVLDTPSRMSPSDLDHSLPSLSSSPSSSASSEVHSPIFSVQSLPGGECSLPIADTPILYGKSSTKAQIQFVDCPSPVFASSFSASDYSQGFLDDIFSYNLPSYESYLQPMDTLSQGSHLL